MGFGRGGSSGIRLLSDSSVIFDRILERYFLDCRRSLTSSLLLSSSSSSSSPSPSLPSPPLSSCPPPPVHNSHNPIPIPQCHHLRRNQKRNRATTIVTVPNPSTKGNEETRRPHRRYSHRNDYDGKQQKFWKHLTSTRDARGEKWNCKGERSTIIVRKKNISTDDASSVVTTAYDNINVPLADEDDNNSSSIDIDNGNDASTILTNMNDVRTNGSSSTTVKDSEVRTKRSNMNRGTYYQWQQQERIKREKRQQQRYQQQKNEQRDNHDCHILPSLIDRYTRIARTEFSYSSALKADGILRRWALQLVNIQQQQQQQQHNNVVRKKSKRWYRRRNAGIGYTVEDYRNEQIENQSKIRRRRSGYVMDCWKLLGEGRRASSLLSFLEDIDGKNYHLNLNQNGIGVVGDTCNSSTGTTSHLERKYGDGQRDEKKDGHKIKSTPLLIGPKFLDAGCYASAILSWTGGTSTNDNNYHQTNPEGKQLRRQQQRSRKKMEESTTQKVIAGEQALRILRRMESLGQVVPELVCYRAILHALAVSSPRCYYYPQSKLQRYDQCHNDYQKVQDQDQGGDRDYILNGRNVKSLSPSSLTSPLKNKMLLMPTSTVVLHLLDEMMTMQHYGNPINDDHCRPHLGCHSIHTPDGKAYAYAIDAITRCLNLSLPSLSIGVETNDTDNRKCYGDISSLDYFLSSSSSSSSSSPSSLLSLLSTSRRYHWGKERAILVTSLLKRLRTVAISEASPSITGTKVMTTATTALGSTNSSITWPHVRCYVRVIEAWTNSECVDLLDHASIVWDWLLIDTEDASGVDCVSDDGGEISSSNTGYDYSNYRHPSRRLEHNSSSETRSNKYASLRSSMISPPIKHRTQKLQQRPDARSLLSFLNAHTAAVSILVAKEEKIMSLSSLDRTLTTEERKRRRKIDIICQSAQSLLQHPPHSFMIPDKKCLNTVVKCWRLRNTLYHNSSCLLININNDIC